MGITHILDFMANNMQPDPDTVGNLVIEFLNNEEKLSALEKWFGTVGPDIATLGAQSEKPNAISISPDKTSIMPLPNVSIPLNLMTTFRDNLVKYNQALADRQDIRSRMDGVPNAHLKDLAYLPFDDRPHPPFVS